MPYSAGCKHPSPSPTTPLCLSLRLPSAEQALIYLKVSEGNFSDVQMKSHVSTAFLDGQRRVQSNFHDYSGPELRGICRGLQQKKQGL